MDAKATAMEFFERANARAMEDFGQPISMLKIALATKGEDTEDWRIWGHVAHIADRAPRNSDDLEYDYLRDQLDFGMGLDDSVQGEILTVTNVSGRVSVRSHDLVLRPKE